MKNLVLKKELEKRNSYDEDAYALIGAELKRKRLSQSQTLSAVASDVCSVSYLCKVEKNQLKPNKYMLKELCKRLDIDSPKMNVLFQMKELMTTSIKYFINDDLSGLEKNFKVCEGFDNYKIQIIKLIYFLYKKDFNSASILSSELLKIVNIMNEFELSIFVLFNSMLAFYIENYNEALDNLLIVVSQEKKEEISYLANLYIFKCYYQLNNALVIKYGEILSRYYFEKNDLVRMDEVRYYLGLYYCKNRMVDDALEQLKHLKNSIFVSSLKFILDLLNFRRSKVNKEKLRPFLKLIYIYLYDNANYRRHYHQLGKEEFYDLDFNDHIASYLLLTTNEEKYQDLVNIYIPISLKSGNVFDQNYFLLKLAKLCAELGKYKAFTKAYISCVESKLCEN